MSIRAHNQSQPRSDEPLAAGRFLLRVVSETLRLRLSNSSRRVRLGFAAVLVGLVAFGRTRRHCSSHTSR